MQFDIFFSISQTPVDSYLPTERTLFENFMSQVIAADELGYETAWVAESHFSSQTQKKNPNPVIPHWQGEVGLNADIFQLSHMVFDRTKNIHMGSAVMNLFATGGPISAAERVASFLSLHALRNDPRKLRLGFSAGRFDYMSRIYGIKPRNAFETKYWPLIKSQAFMEATEIFLRLLKKEELASNDVRSRFLAVDDFKTTEDWELALSLAPQKEGSEKILIPTFYSFERLKIVPQEFDLNLLDLIVGTHLSSLQTEINHHLPVKVFNLSITKPEIIEETHKRMSAHYNSSGGAWQRSYMPRTSFVFINEEKGVSPKDRSVKAKEEAAKALTAYWKALEGTVDPQKIQEAADNALIGTADEISYQIQQRFHDDDTLMLWFDFFNHNNERVLENMQAFKEKVAERFDTRNRGKVEFLQR